MGKSARLSGAPVLLLDEGVAVGAALRMRARHVGCVHVREAGLGGASDSSVMAYALRRGMAIATFDEEFHQLLAARSMRRPSVIRVRVEALRAPAQAALLQAVIRTIGADLMAGCAVSVADTGTFRVRRLPLKG